MATRSGVTVVLDSSAINKMLYDISELSARRAAGRVRDRARTFAPKRSGRLANSINARIVSRTSTVCTYSVGTSMDYAMAQERGTGPIYARQGGVLAFAPKGSVTVIFRPRTRGVPATYFLRRAYSSIGVSDYLP